MEYVALGVAFIALLVAFSKGDTPTTGAIWMNPPEPVKSTSETLAEIKAREELERDYKWEQPKYGMYLGKKIYPKDLTEEILESQYYVKPEHLGKWVKK